MSGIRLSTDPNVVWYSDEWMNDKGKKNLRPKKREIPIYREGEDHGLAAARYMLDQLADPGSEIYRSDTAQPSLEEVLQ